MFVFWDCFVGFKFCDCVVFDVVVFVLILWGNEFFLVC